jgi:uncharacterized integral membrane protein (TIGR00698 family)
MSRTVGPAGTDTRTRSPLGRALPGVTLASAAALVSVSVNAAIPLVSSLLVAIVLGVVLRNVGLVRPVAEHGLQLCARTVLRAGVVLLGLQLSIPRIVGLGWDVVGVVAATVAVTYVAVVALGRYLRLDRPSAVLIATGTAICGAAAVAAMSAALPRRGGPDRGATDEQIDDAAATAVAAVTLFGTAALLLLPLVARGIGLGTEATGVWIGAGVHEVGQVVAAAGIAGAGVADIAVVTKLGRVVLLAPLVAAVSYLENRRDPAPAGQPARSAPVVPPFVVGFLAMVVIRSTIPLPEVVTDAVAVAATGLLAVAMVAMGTGVKIGLLFRTGGRALLVGAVAGAVSAGVALAMVLALT